MTGKALGRHLSSSSSVSFRRRACVLVVGSGRMGKIRAGLINSNPRYQLLGIVDPEVESAGALASKYGVSGGGATGAV